MAVNANPDQQVFVYQDDPSNNDGTLSITSPWDFTAPKVFCYSPQFWQELAP